jgi:hypothetical protein
MSAWGSISTEIRCPRYVRFPPDRDQVADVSALRFRAKKRLMHCNITRETQTERPPRAAVSPNSDLVVYSGGCYHTGILTLPAPAKQAHCADTGCEEW